MEPESQQGKIVGRCRIPKRRRFTFTHRMCASENRVAPGFTIGWALLLISQAFIMHCYAQASEDRGPAQVVDTAAKSILSPIDAHPDQYQPGSVNLNQLVNMKLMPYFDVKFAARFVLGRWWRNASAEQRTQFIEAFSRLLLHNCANDLVQFSADHLDVLAYRGDPNASYATVDTKMHRRTCEVSDLSFSMPKTASGWKAYDALPRAPVDHISQSIARVKMNDHSCGL